MTLGDLINRFDIENDKNKIIVYVDRGGRLSTIDLEEVTDTAILLSESPLGEWIRTALYGQTCYECNNCSTHYDYVSNFCPNCGAKMKMAVNLCDDCKFTEDCNPTLKRRDGVNTTQCSRYE